MLWFIRLADEFRVYEHDKAGDLRERVIEVIAEQLGVDKFKVTGDLSFSNERGADSLDVAEFVMELEEEFGFEDLPERKLMRSRGHDMHVSHGKAFAKSLL